MHLLHQPLIRLLAINLAIGVSVAALMLGGLLALNPGGLRNLILADRAPLAALGLLLFGLVVTFGSVAMGTAAKHTIDFRRGVCASGLDARMRVQPT